MDKIFTKPADRTVFALCAGFAVGFLAGAYFMAVVDRKARRKRIRRDSDENHIYSE